MKTVRMIKFALFTLVTGFAILCFSSCKKNNVSNVITTSTDEYINYTVNGNADSYTMPADSVFSDTTAESPSFGLSKAIMGHRIPNVATDFVKLNVNTSAIGAGSTQQLTLFSSPQTGGNSNFYPLNLSSATPIMVTITEYGAVNEYIAGNFSAQLTGPAPGNITYNITCNFRVRRRS